MKKIFAIVMVISVLGVVMGGCKGEEAAPADGGAATTGTTGGETK